MLDERAELVLAVLQRVVDVHHRVSIKDVREALELTAPGNERREG